MPMRLTRRGFLAASSASLAMHPFSLRAQGTQAHLRLLATTDLHVHVFPYDYYADRTLDTVGLARTAALIEGIRSEATNSVLFDNGDFLQGNPLGDYVAYEKGLNPGDLHPVIAAMNVLGYDAGTLGNHEFNYGLPFLAAAVARADFPIVNANIATAEGATPAEDTLLQPPYVILEREVTDGAGTAHPIRIGVIGFVPPQVMQWDRAHLEGNVTARDIVRAAEAWVPKLRAEGADIVVALAHTGVGSAAHEDGAENAATALAAVDGIDALITGHAHRVLPGPDYEGLDGVDAAAGRLHGKPAVMPGFWGSHMGLIDLMLEHDGDGWRVIDSTVEARPISHRDANNTVVPDVESIPEVEAAAQEDHDATLAYVRRGVGKTEAPLHSYFALVADDPSVQIVSIAQMWYIAQQLKGTEYESLPLVSAAAPFKAGGRGGPDYYTDVPVGDVAIKNVADLYLYPNTIRAVKVTGEQLRLWLERSAGMFNQIAAGAKDEVLLNPDFPSFNYDVIDGVTYEIDLSQPAMFAADGTVVAPEAQRIINLQYNGAPIDPAQEFVVATNNYRASGGGAFPGADGSTVIYEGPDTNRDIIVRYIIDQGTINPAADANWRFAPMPGTTVLFDTGPGGAAYADAVPGVSITPIGAGPDGFARFRIAL